MDKIAAWFGRHSMTALVYDARTIGRSDGLPRTDLDPQKMAEDNSDAVTVFTSPTFATSSVGSSNILIEGNSTCRKRAGWTRIA